MQNEHLPAPRAQGILKGQVLSSASSSRKAREVFARRNKSSHKLLIATLVTIIFIIGLLSLKVFGVENNINLTIPSQAVSSVNLLTIFLTGLLVGGLTCLAVQGGLLASTIAQRQEQGLKDRMVNSGNAMPILSFLGSKLVAYTILGFLLGWFGSLFELSLTTKVIMQAAVAIFMIGTALNLLNAHPVFRYFVIQPPRFLTRIVRKQSKSQEVFAPALLGAFTVFIPCGTTQAMMALSIASGSALLGAAILFTFTLGTSPLFFVLGYFTTKLGETLQQKFMKVASVAIILLAVYNLDGAIALSGSNLTLKNIWTSFWCTVSFCNDSSIANAQVAGATSEAVQEATISIEAASYNPNSVTVKAGSPVTLRLVNNGGRGCTQSFTIPRFGIQKIIPLGSSETIQFTAPSEPGPLSFMCGMGMFRGIINVI